MSDGVPAHVNPAMQQQLPLRLCALLSPLKAMSVHALLDALDVDDPELSATIADLVGHGYVATWRGRLSPVELLRSTTVVGLTPQGRRALAGHINALKSMAQ